MRLSEFRGPVEQLVQPGLISSPRNFATCAGTTFENSQKQNGAT